MLSCWPGSANIDRSISTPKSKLSSRQPDSTSAAKHPRKSRFRLCPKSRLYFRTDAAASCVSAEVIITEPSLLQAEKPLRSAAVVSFLGDRKKFRVITKPKEATGETHMPVDLPTPIAIYID